MSDPSSVASVASKSMAEDSAVFLEKMEAAETMDQMAKALVWARKRLEARSPNRADSE